MSNLLRSFHHFEAFPNYGSEHFQEELFGTGVKSGPFQVELDGVRLWFVLCLTARTQQGKQQLMISLALHRGPLRSLIIEEIELGVLARDATRVYASKTKGLTVFVRGKYVHAKLCPPNTDTLRCNGVLGDNDTVYAFFTFKLKTDEFSQIKPNRYAPPLDIVHNLAKDVGCCFDFELRSSLDGGTIPCHKFVLAAASPSLEAFVLANEDKGFAKLDVYERAIRQLVHVVYSEHTLDTFAFSRHPKTFSTMRQMLFLATRFELPVMLSALEELLIKCLVQIGSERHGQPLFLERQALVVAKLVKKYSLKKVDEFMETLNNNSKQMFKTPG